MINVFVKAVTSIDSSRSVCSVKKTLILLNFCAATFTRAMVRERNKKYRSSDQYFSFARSMGNISLAWLCSRDHHKC